MRYASQVLRCVLLAAGIGAAPQTFAQDAKIVLASVQPFNECTQVTYSPVLRSGCYTVPKAKERFAGTPDHPAVREWKLPPKDVEDRIYPPTEAMLSARPVFKKQGRRLIARRGCVNCRYVSAQSTQGKQLARYYARQIGVQASSIVGFFVPFPFSIAVNTVTCAAVSVGFDAKEYREDYNEEPTGEQYGKSFGNNLLYCSPIGGFISAQTPLQFILAMLGFSGYFVNLPTPVGYAQQALPVAEYHVQQHAQAAQQAHAAQRPQVRTAKQGRPSKKLASVR